MSDLSRYQHLGAVASADFYLAPPDYLLVVPRPGFVDTPQFALEKSDFLNAYARSTGKTYGLAIVMANILTQDPETRRVYQTQTSNGLYFGLAMVVDSALSRALATFFLGLSRPAIPTQIFGSIEKCLEWLDALRPQA